MESSLAVVERPRRRYYKVREGDSLWRIAAAQYGDPSVWPEISRANRLLNPDLLLVGITLVLPDLPQHGRYPTTRGSTRQPPVRRDHLIVSRSDTSRGDLHASDATARRGGLSPARVMPFHGVKYSGNLAKAEIHTPDFDAELVYNGDISIKEEGSVATLEYEDGKAKATLAGNGSEFSVDSRGEVTGKLKAEYDSGLRKEAAGFNLSFDPKAKELKISAGFSLGDKRVGISEFQFVPPNTYKYKYEPREVKIRSGRMEYEGKVGYELTITFKQRPPDLTAPAGQSVSVFQPAGFASAQRWFSEHVRLPSGREVVAGVAVLGAAALVIAVASDPMTWPALIPALRMMQFAVAR